MLYSMLPSVVQSRLPRLPSLRRSVSMYGLTSREKTVESRSGDRTPEMEYTSAMVLSGARGVMSADRDEMAGYFSQQSSSDEDLAGTLSGKKRQPIELSELKSGIGWKFANQGLNLLSLAVEESSTISQDSRFGNASFARQLYLHAMTYLLRALPSDLTAEEQLSVRSALPAGVVEPLRVELDSAGYTGAKTADGAGDNSPSLLHRTLASTIVQIFILFQFMLPYLKYFLNMAYQYERTHKISEKVLSQSLDAVDTLGKRGLSLTGAIYGIGDGKVGQALNDAACWFVEGVTGGIHEGLGEGLAIMGGRRPQTVERG